MGVSTDGVISFGVVCGEETDLPWQSSEHDHDLESWWRFVNGYVSPFDPWTAEGDYAAGWESGDPRFEEYDNHRSEWMAANPLPIWETNYCSDGCPMYAVTVPGAGLSCSRGYPETFDPAQLSVRPEEVERLKAFLEKHKIEYKGEPGWLLTSYWG